MDKQSASSYVVSSRCDQEKGADVGVSLDKGKGEELTDLVKDLIIANKD